MMSFNYVPANAPQTMAFYQAAPGTTLTLGSPQGQQSQPQAAAPGTPTQCQPISAPIGTPMPVTYVRVPATNLATPNNVGIINAGQPMIFQMASAQPQTFIAAAPAATPGTTPTTAVLQPSYTLSAPSMPFININNVSGAEVKQATPLQAQATITAPGKPDLNEGEQQEIVHQQIQQQQPAQISQTYLEPSQGIISQASTVPTTLNSTPQNPLMYMFEVDTDMETIKSTLPQIPSGDKWIRGITGPNFSISGLELYDPEEDDKPKYVNPKQFSRILKRRAEREKLIREGRIPEERAKYLHESRHRHALNRTRLKDGRFDSKG